MQDLLIVTATTEVCCHVQITAYFRTRGTPYDVLDSQQVSSQ